MSGIMDILHATMEVPVAVGVIGWGALAMLVGQAIRATVEVLSEWRAERRSKPHQPRQLGTCVTGKPACHECMLGDGYCRKEIE